MTEPQTSWTQRFSDRGAEPTPWADTLAVIVAAEIFWVATVRAERSTPRHPARGRVAR